MPQDHGKCTEQAFRAFVRTTGLFRNRMDPYFAKFGISASQWGALRALQRAEGEGLHGLRLTDLGQRLLVKAPSISGVVDRLERAGLVTREASSQDLRAKRVSLTADGRKLLERVLQEHPRQIKTIMAGLSGREQEQLLHLMRRLGEHLESLGAVGKQRRLHNPAATAEQESR